jgi:hypothetical protein
LDLIPDLDLLKNNPTAWIGLNLLGMECLVLAPRIFPDQCSHSYLVVC